MKHYTSSMPFFLGFLLLAAVFGLHQVSDPDFPWLLKAGEIIWTQGIPRQDIFSFTRAGQEWINAQWLFQALIYPVWKTCGFLGLNLLLLALLVSAFALLFRAGNHPGQEALTALLGLLTLWAASQRLNLRPESLSFLYLALILFAQSRFRQGRRRIVWLLPLAQWAWANSEGIWPLGLALIFAGLLEAWFENWRGTLSLSPASRKEFTLASLLALPLCLATPYAWRGFVFPWRLLAQVSSENNYIKQMIAEFQPVFSAGDPLWLRWPFLILIALGAVSFWLQRRRLRPFQFALWLLLLFLSFRAMRNVALFVLYSFPLISAELGSFLAGRPWPRLRAVWAAAFIVLAGVATGTIATNRFFLWDQSYRIFGTGFKETIFPAQAVRQLLNSGFEGKVFNQMSMGGYLIWKGYPRWKVYSDARLEVYGAEFFRRETRLFTDYSSFVAEDEKYGFGAVLLNYRAEPLLPFILDLNADPHWRLFYQDKIAVVFLKTH